MNIINFYNIMLLGLLSIYSDHSYHFMCIRKFYIIYSYYTLNNTF